MIKKRIEHRFQINCESYDMNTHTFLLTPKVKFYNHSQSDLSFAVGAKELLGIEREWVIPHLDNLDLDYKKTLSGLAYNWIKDQEFYIAVPETNYEVSGKVLLYLAEEVARTTLKSAQCVEIVDTKIPAYPTAIDEFKLINSEVSSLLAGEIIQIRAKDMGTGKTEILDVRLNNKIELLINPKIRVTAMIKADEGFIYFCNPYILKIE